MENKRGFNRVILLITIVLVIIGVIMVASASPIVGESKFRSPFFFFQRHLVRMLLGLMALFVFSRIPYTFYRKVSIHLIFVSFFLLVAIFIWGREVRSANRWLPVFTFVLQPVEVAKVALVIFIASRIAELGKNVKKFKEGFLPLVAVCAAMAVLVAFQPNVSNAVLIVGVTFTMLFVGGCRLSHILPVSLGLAGTAVPFLYRLPVVQERLQAFLNRSDYLRSLNWQVEQSLIALGSGFIFGSGPGRGHQKFNFLPDPHTDFIYSIIGEEIGLIGTLLVLILFVLLLKETMKVAREAPDRFASLLAFGLGFLIFTTALINISMALGMIPTAGMPLPFISYGGSSLTASLASIGIILNVSANRSATGSSASWSRSTSRRKAVFARRRTGKTGVRS